MKLINEKGKLFGLINAIDFCVILLIVLIAGGTYYKFGVLDKTSTSAAMQPISYTVEIKKVRGYIFDNVQECDVLYDKTSGNSIGTITKIEGKPAEEVQMGLDGTMINTEVENRFDVTLSVEAEGVVSDNSYHVNRTYELVRGSTRKFMTKYFEGEGKIIDFQ